MNIEEAAKILISGGVVALPTETVYGLAACLKCKTAIDRIFSLKGRPKDNPIIVHIANRKQVKSLSTMLPAGATELMDAFWPGSLTIILEANKDEVSETVRGGLPTVGIRMPNHADILAVIERCGPLVAPSANLSGKPSSTSAQHVISDFGPDLPILDGGRCKNGLESTIVYFDGTHWNIAREGSVSREEIAAVLGYPVMVTGKAIAPGTKYRHYAPEAKLELESDDQCCAVLGFAERDYRHAKKFILGSLSNPASLAFNLYDQLREIDSVGISRVWVDMDFPTGGIFDTLRERLSKAAART